VSADIATCRDELGRAASAPEEARPALQRADAKNAAVMKEHGLGG